MVNKKEKKMEVKEKIIEEMISFGFSKEVAEKALTESKGTTLDEVLEWIEEKGDVDALKEIGEKYKNVEVKSEEKKKATDETIEDNSENLKEHTKKRELTAEEVEEKALNLQKKIRERNIQKEKEEEIERERKRMLTMKEMQERRRQLEEHEKQMLIESRIREKNEHAKERERQFEKFKQEYKERFGIEYVAETKKKTIDELSENEKREEIAIFLNSLKTKYKHKKKEVIAALNILKTYFTNIKNNILEKKFQTIKKENKVFSEKIKIYDEMLQVMLLVGFIDSGECYTIKGVPNTYLLSSAMRFIDLVIRNFDQ